MNLFFQKNEKFIVYKWKKWNKDFLDFYSFFLILKKGEIKLFHKNCIFLLTK